jgi:hypothetical protein
MTDMQIYYVEWRDSAITEGECAVDEISGVAVMCTAGFLVREDEDSILMCRDTCTYDGKTETIRGAIVIPRECIQTWFKIEAPKELLDIWNYIPMKSKMAAAWRLAKDNE